MSKNRWTKEEIDFIIANWRTSTANQMSAVITRHSKHAINRKLKRLDIKLSEEDLSWRMQYARSKVDSDNICRTDQTICINDLDNTTLQILLGSMLGDGCSTKQSKNLRNFRFTEGHSLEQEDYVRWKAEWLALFKPRVYRYKDIHVSLITKMHPIFSLLRDKFYPSQDKCTKNILPLDLLSKLDMLGLLVWYLDDGNFGAKGRPPQPTIGAKGWANKDLIELIDLLNSKFSLSMYVYTCKTNQIVKIPKKDWGIFDNWSALLTKFDLPTSMHYKIKGVSHSN